MTSDASFPFLGFGAGLRSVHYPYILGHLLDRDDERLLSRQDRAAPDPPHSCATRHCLDWFEVISENYMIPGGRPLAILDQIRERYPIVMHGVSLSIGSTDPLDMNYLSVLKQLAKRCEPAWISDHICWSSNGVHSLHDLLPLPYTEEAVQHVASRVKQVQDYLGRQILLENASSYLEFSHSTMPEWEFVNAIATGADCKVLLDVNNVYVSSVNHNFDPYTYIDAIHPDAVKQFHLAGHSNKGEYIIDTHDDTIIEPVWQLYEHAVQRFGAVSTLIEWDDRIPDFPELMKEVTHAKERYESICTKLGRNTGAA